MIKKKDVIICLLAFIAVVLICSSCSTNKLRPSLYTYTYKRVVELGYKCTPFKGRAFIHRITKDSVSWKKR